jgi:Concanavalin A-like lectin/glucanases superfamily/Fibronectin type III domain
MLVAMATGVLLAATSGAVEAALLYPDLETLPPRTLRLDYTDVSVDGSGVLHHVLRFSNTAVNVGEGPVEIRATIDDSHNPPSGPAYQRVYDSNGGASDLPLGGSSLYYHAIHKHYHFDDWGGYQLWTKAAYDRWVSTGAGGPDLVGTKTTSCVTDEEFVAPIAPAVFPGKYPPSKCMPDAQHAIGQGLSPGWGDTYDFYRFEQWIDLGPSRSLPDGTYVLRSIADPDNIVYESPGKADGTREGAADNAAVTTFGVSGGQLVDFNAPSGTVTIEHVDATTTSSTVRLDVLGRDDVSGVDQFQVSNDGSAWATYSNSSFDSNFQTLQWNLANASYGGSSSAGLKTVYVRFHDRAGHWGPAVTDAIAYAPDAPPPATSSYGQAVEDDGPVSWWRLGETSGPTAADQEGANPGGYGGAVTLGGASLLATEPGNFAAAFGGGYVAVPDSAALRLSDKLTLEAWIKPSSLPAAGQFASILTKADSYTLQLDGPQLELAIVQGGVRHRLKAPAGAIVPGGAFHVVGTYDGATQRLYVDGQQVASQALTGTADSTANPLFVGAWSANQEHFHGTIDEPAVYAKALGAGRVAAHHVTGIARLTAPAGLSATPLSTSEVGVGWTNTASGETGLVVQRSMSASFSPAVTVVLPAGTSSYRDSGLEPGTTYWYRVKATVDASSSPWSQAAQATTAKTYAQTIRDDHPVSYWRLDETSGTVAGDETVANPGAFVGATVLGAPGLIPADPASTAVGFDGGSAEVRVGQSGSLNLGSSMTLEAWIRPSSLPAAGSLRTILAKTGSYALELDGPAPAFSVYVLGARFALAAPAGTVAAGRRSHVVGTYDGTTMRLWVDGAEVASRALSGQADQTLAGARIGSWDGHERFFAGAIDEVALYAAALSGAQIATHAAAGPVAPPDVPVVAGGAAGSPGETTHAAPRRSLRARLRPTRLRLHHGRPAATLVLNATVAGRARLTLVRLTGGTRRGRRQRCVVGPGAGRRCTIAKTVGSRELKVGAGRQTLPLPGRYGRARLAPGRWRLVIALERATPVRVTFIVSR